MMTKFVGTDGDDTYTLREGERDVVRMLGGDDIVFLSATSFGSDDRIDAGRGADTAMLAGGGFYNFGHARFTSFESMTLSGEGRFEIYIDDSVVAVGGTLALSAADLPRGASMFIDGAAERDGSLSLRASGGDDVLTGGGRADLFVGGRGKDLITGNEGGDVFAFVADSGRGDVWGKDRITDFHPGEDRLIFVTNSISSFEQLLIERTREGLVVRTPDSNSSITLLGVLPRDLHPSDVTFQPLGFDPPSQAHAPAFLHDHGLLV